MRRFLRASLASHGYDVVLTSTVAEALARATEQPPDVVLLDLGLPDMGGISVLTRLREWSGAPVIILTARGEEAQKVEALDKGADDYLVKPFGVEELLARMRAALRRISQRGLPEEPVYQSGGLRVDLNQRRVWARGAEVHLTPIEYRLLTTLIRHAGRVLTHQFLLREVWGETYVRETHYLRIFMRQLRHKLEADPARPVHLLTEAGVGYRFSA